ncbi:imidazole glycerol phosphate synthase subunit HisH [Candidatus Woesearchaeota archaeon]|nr:imidazole glycerol phosphate synthase subunit HisH [Candidatus Woesearchaeota archaeon]
MICIVDCGTGNLSSIKNALDFLGASSKITSNPGEIQEARMIILPGVGAFGYFMGRLREKKLEIPIKKAISEGKPFLGICLGLQVLFEESQESKGVRGLGILKGRVMRFTQGKVPQIGWNKIIPTNPGIFEEGFAYYVNSYYAEPADRTLIAAVSNYYGDFPCAIRQGNITAVQFHPEKSGKYGLELMKRVLEC